MTVEEELAELKIENKRLWEIADAAAYCIMDLNDNMDSAKIDLAAEKISKIDYGLITIRHYYLDVALCNIGYTEINEKYGYLEKPKTGSNDE